jgi:hypothetical protein
MNLKKINTKIKFHNENHQLPILIIAYKRPHLLQKLLLIIENIDIDIKLYIFIDGYINESDKFKVNKCIDFSKDLTIENKFIYYSLNNLGCAFGPISAINWFFENEEFGVILEDDCLPDPSFFKYCHELLIKYFFDNRIYHISGSQFDDLDKYNHSYVFSRESHNWGWATWRRAWNHYEYFKIPGDFDETIWDFQWNKTIQKNNGLTILPKVNLVKNIGYGKDATHTTYISDCYLRETHPIQFPLSHPILDFKQLYVSRSI